MADTYRNRAKSYSGPVDELGPGVHELSPGVWVTSGRTAVIETPTGLWVIDPGDEVMLSGNAPVGPLAELLHLCDLTDKKVSTVAITHAHPDHIANLGIMRAVAATDERLGSFKLLAHEAGPLEPDIPIGKRVVMEGLIEIIPNPGHCHYGDDISFFLAKAGVLFPGDLVQPKGETWAEAFYPSPFPYFTDGDLYLASLEKLLPLEFQTLATGHREIRTGPAARQWVELCHNAIRRVADEVADWQGGDDLELCASTVFKKLCGERGIEKAVVEARMAGGRDSAFYRFDLPGFAYFWNTRRNGGA